VQVRLDWRDTIARDEQEERHDDLVHEWRVSCADGARVIGRDRARSRQRASRGLLRGSGRGLLCVLWQNAPNGAKAVISRTALVRVALHSAFICRAFDPVLVMIRAPFPANVAHSSRAVRSPSSIDLSSLVATIISTPAGAERG
jgi:hypothetical protein